MEKYKNLLTSTTLIPLWAKAVETLSDDPILQDPNAYAMLQSLGYDLSLFDKDRQNASQVGCCLRAKWMDDETLTFIRKHQSCQVIQLGAGIDDRYSRIGIPADVAYWYDLDLDEVATMRREVMPQHERAEIISMNMLDTAWMTKLAANRLPTLIIIEGVLMFLHEKEIQELFNQIARHLPGATLLFDSVPALAVGRARYHDSVRKLNQKIEYTWGMKDCNGLKGLSPHVVVEEALRMSDLPGAIKFRFLLRMMYKIPYFYRNANQWLVRIRLTAQAD